MELPGTFINETAFCGRNHTWNFWSESEGRIEPCFHRLFLVCPFHFLLTVVSAYYVGYRVRAVGLRQTLQVRVAILLRAVINVILALTPPGTYVLLILLGLLPWAETGWAELLALALQMMAWLANLAYVLALINRVVWSPRGHRSIILVVMLCAMVDTIGFKDLLSQAPTDSEQEIRCAGAWVQLVALIIYLLTLIPGRESGDMLQPILMADEFEDPEFRHVRHAHYLGVAKQNTHCLSRSLLHWVEPLINKGNYGDLKSADDVFNLPIDMSTPVVSQRFQMVITERQSSGHPVGLFKVLFSSFGLKFFTIGILKFMADCAGFASPILLNRLVSFMENQEEDMRWGYLYAGGLTVSTLVVAMCNTHFNLFMSELGLKIRASIITAVYHHTLSVTSANLRQFSMGEVINFMSTDTDRIVNFCPSLHAAWSLPFQFTITIVLLYQQVGIASMAGVGFTVLMIPLNKIIADHIGRLSTKMMSAKDQRVKIMSEALFGIRVIKFFTWENFFTDKIQGQRKSELKYLKGRKYLDAVCVYLWATTPVLISVLTFTTYVLLGNALTAAKVFTSVALFAMLTGPLNAFPWVLNGVVEATVSIKRISAYLSLPQIDRESLFSQAMDIVNAEDEGEVDLVCSRMDLSVGRNRAEATRADFVLENLNLTVRKGEFLGVIGRVGSGKSTMLMAILGEVNRSRGAIYVSDPNEGIAYVQQEPWLQQGSVRSNILFGRDFEPEWYEKVVEACALKEDFNQLSSGDGTNVGEAGVMLSGGQKARVALARAVYQNKEIYLIDDIFSAVDVPVGSHIYRKCIMGLLGKKTRILATHHRRFLAGASQTIVLDNGEVTFQGPPKSILSKVDLGKETERGEKEKTESGIPNDEVEEDSFLSVELVEDEGQSEGHVKFDMYKNYWGVVGNVLSVTILLFMLLMQGSRNFTDIWLAQWVSDSNATEGGDMEKNNRDHLIVYGSIAVFNTFASLARAFLFAYGGIRAARAVHEKLLHAILRARPVFFDGTPMGRILNRFSSDLYTVDDSLPFILNIFLDQVCGVFGPLIVCAYSVPWIMLILVPLAFLYYDIQKKYRPASRDLKRMGSVSLSPIYAHFSETLSGLPTIRAMKAVNRFNAENEDNLEANQRAQYAGIAAAQWLELRLQLIGCAVVTGIALIAVIQHHINSIDPGYVGLAISYSLGITSKLSDLVKSFTETEKQFVAVERCYQFIDEVEPESNNGYLSEPPQDWPDEGVVEFQNVSMRYRDNLPLALQGLDMDTKRHEKVGIVGRTGSGKSSIFQSLFRMVHLAEGQILVDGINIHDLDLHVLRRHLAIIPQDPFLFSGSVRENLDPLGTKSDTELWESLEQSHLTPVIQRHGGLDGQIAERGQSLSVGQRQLLCLARAILSSSKIVCVDEATANVDLETDSMVQEILQTALGDRTVISIAHRTDTVMGVDRLFVMSGGKVLETGKPQDLLEDPQSAFSRHVAQS